MSFRVKSPPGLNKKNMRYENPHTMWFHQGSPAYSEAAIWQKCEQCGREFLGSDSLEAHVKERHGAE